MVILWVEHSRTTFLPRSILLPFNLGFFTFSLLVITFLMGWCFLVHGTADMLLMGTAALTWGAAATVSGAVGLQDVNASVTIVNMASWLCAALNLAASIVAIRSRGTVMRKLAVLVGAYLGGVAAVALISTLTISKEIPVFFVEMAGGTPIRTAVIGSAALMFCLAGVILRVTHRHSLTSFVHWYSLALFLFAASSMGIIFELSFDTSLSWTARFTRYLGCAYMVVAAASSVPNPRHWSIMLDAALTEANRRYVDLFNLAADGIIVHEPIAGPSHGRIRQTNQAACALLGYSEDEIMHLTIFDLIAPEYRLDPSEAIEAMSRTGVIRHEKTLLTKKGQRIPTEMTTRVFRDPSGPMEIAVIRDITARRRAETALRESEERLRLALGAAQIGTFEYRPDTGEVLMDDRSKQLWGMDAAAALTYYDVLERVYVNDRPRFAKSIEAALNPESTGMYESEYRIVWPDGSIHWHTAKGRVDYEWSSGRRLASRLVGVHLDSTGQKQSEIALWEAVQRLDAHIDNSPLAAIEFDPDFRVTRWSEEARRLFGWSAEEVLGRSAAEMHLGYEEDMEKVARNSAAMREGTLRRNMTVTRNYRRDGSVIECEWYNSAIFDAEGRLTSVLSQVLDVTDRKQTEERLRQAQKMESIAILAGGVAHDFNNLLVGIIGNASLAMEVLPEDNPAERLLEGIITAGEQAAHLTSQMLAYSGQGRFLMEPVDLSQVVRDVTEMVRANAPQKIALQLDLASALPAIKGDRTQIYQALMNLIINATEAIGSNTGRVVVRTGTREISSDELKEFQGADLSPGRYTTLEVQDTGSGMDDAVKGRIFDPFFTTKFQGRGLGLPAVAGIVRGHKGGFRVRTAPGCGSSFQLVFPAMDGRAGYENNRSRYHTDATDFTGCGTVLVVDDEERVRTAARLALEHRGCHVLTADSGAAAIEVLREASDHVVLVILDLSMPGMSGAEALPRLLEIKPNLNVLVSSGYAEEDALSRFEGMPVSGFIQKPYTAREIAEKVRSVMECYKSADSDWPHR